MHKDITRRWSISMHNDITRRWSKSLHRLSPKVVTVFLLLVYHRILWKYHQKMTNHRIDIRVRTLFSLSAFLALGVLFIFRNSSITTFSTVSIELRSFFWGVRESGSPEAWFVICCKIFGTLPMVEEQPLTAVVGFGDIILLLCSRWATGVASEESWFIRTWGIGLLISRPSLPPKRSLLLSMAWSKNFPNISWRGK